MSTWKIAELCNTSQPNIRYWLIKFNLKTLRTLNQQLSLRVCLTCKTLKSNSEFYKKGEKYTSHCIVCYLKNHNHKRLMVKQQCVEYLGGACAYCGYNKSIAALEYHHIDPHTKDKAYTNKRLNFDKLKIELDKCILLCSNCHRELHYLDNINL